MESSKIQIHLVGNNLFSNSQKAFTLENSKKFGERKEGRIIYSPFEVLFLINRKDAEILKNNKNIGFEELIKIFSKKDREFYTKYLVFSELRKKGYVVKAGLKFGGEFRVYEQHNLKHAKYICYVVKEGKIDSREIVAKARIAHSTAKKLLLAIVDSEEDVLFYEVDWVKI